MKNIPTTVCILISKLCAAELITQGVDQDQDQSLMKSEQLYGGKNY